MYDYYLGGKDHFAVDREAAEQVLQVAPQTPALARANRAFLRRAVRHLTSAGIRQFVDIGAGLPTQGNVHEIAPEARVAYLDHDPSVLSHARALLATTPNTLALPGDLRNTVEILKNQELRNFLDFTEPIGLLLVAVLHCLTEEDDPYAQIAELREAVPSGSHLVISHISAREQVESARQGAAVYRRASTTMTLRDREQISRMFDGFELLEPGLADLQDWRPDPDELDLDGRLPGWFLCGVGRKP
ncbi:SAM-dependent methyltransferase [Nonomuraea sp. NPDC050310]|uniref:SAM-dependent methyltransferase n=1 Tax=unclassified Nonomuraea TaxID=2593643 RepID=UPI0033CB4CF7